MSKSFKLASWNVKSVRIRLPLLKKLAEEIRPQVICLQEVKAKEEDFPFAEIEALGYPHTALYGIPVYNGVAILSQTPLNKVEKPDWVGKHDARHIRASVYDDIEINNIYIPAGGDVPDPLLNLSFAHKLSFIDDVAEWYEQRRSAFEGKKTVFCGDFNIAPLENDVWSHKQMLKVVSHTPVEVQRLQRLFHALDFTDAVRFFHPEPEKIYTWWSYRNPGWRDNNKGRRLDHVWVTSPLKERLLGIEICKGFRAEERPSDHVPVVAEISL